MSVINESVFRVSGLINYLENSFLMLISSFFLISVSANIMSTAKRLVLSLRGRNESQNGNGESSTRLYSSSSPGHELDEIAVVSCGATDSARVSYGSLSLGAVVQPANGPRYVPGRC